MCSVVDRSECLVSIVSPEVTSRTEQLSRWFYFGFSHLVLKFFGTLKRKNISISSSSSSSSSWWNNCKENSTLTFVFSRRSSWTSLLCLLIWSRAEDDCGWYSREGEGVFITSSRQLDRPHVECSSHWSTNLYPDQFVPDHLCLFSLCRWTAMRIRMDKDVYSFPMRWKRISVEEMSNRGHLLDLPDEILLVI